MLFAVKSLVLFIIWSRCKNKNEKLFKEKQSFKILKIIGLIEIFNYFKNMVEENISQKFRLKKLDDTRYCFLEEMELNELMSKKYENACTTLNCSGLFLISASAT